MLRESPDDQLVVDARTAREYRRGHIPGAISSSWEQWCEPAPAGASSILTRPGYWGVLDGTLANGAGHRLAEAGFSSARRIVVYADGVASKGSEGRIAWMLLYLGAERVALLDGGWSAWIQSGGERQLDVASPRPGRFTVEPRAERRVEITSLRAAHAARRFPLGLDTRSRHEFAGLTFAYMPRPGRLPRSLLLPYGHIFESSGAFVGKSRYLELLPREAHAAPDLFAYCEVGVRASMVALLHEIHTGRILPVFDGSMMEWGLSRELPLGPPC